MSTFPEVMRGLPIRLAVCAALGSLPSVYAPAVHASDALPASTAHGLDQMVPAGRWIARAEVRGNHFDHEYDSNGKRVAFAHAYSGVELDASALSSLAPLGPGATLGSTTLAAEAFAERIELTFGYGLTKDLTVGAIIPFGRTYMSVDFSVLGGNVGWNPLFDPGQPVGPSNYPFAPVGGGASEPLGTAGVQQILTNPAFGYAYRPLQTSSVHDMGDPTVGALWRAQQNEDSSTVLALGYRIGLAKQDDPDDLFDLPLGDGSDDLRLRLEHFRNLGAGFDLRLMAMRTIQLEDQVTRRVTAPGEFLATATSQEKLDRDLGDFWEWDVELGKQFGDWRVSGTWHRYDKEGDRYASALGTDTSELEKDTRLYADQWRLGVSWSGVHAWQEKLIPLPLIFKLELQETYEGRNMTDVRDLYLVTTAMF